MQNLLGLLVRHVPKPVTWIASSNQSPTMSSLYQSMSGPQSMQPVALSNTGFTSNASSAYFSPMVGTSTLSTPMSIMYVPQVSLPFQNTTGMSIGATPVPGMQVTGITSINPVNSTQDTAANVTTSEKSPPSMPFEIPWAWR